MPISFATLDGSVLQDGCHQTRFPGESCRPSRSQHPTRTSIWPHDWAGSRVGSSAGRLSACRSAAGCVGARTIWRRARSTLRVPCDYSSVDCTEHRLGRSGACLSPPRGAMQQSGLLAWRLLHITPDDPHELVVETLKMAAGPKTPVLRHRKRGAPGNPGVPQ